MFLVSFVQSVVYRTPPLSVATCTVSPFLRPFVYRCNSSPCAVRQSANTKRHITVIVALSAHMLLYTNSKFIISLFIQTAVQFQRVEAEERAVWATALLSTADFEHAQNSLGTCSSLLRLRFLSETSPNTITQKGHKLGPLRLAEPAVLL